MNEQQVRRAITILKKNGFIEPHHVHETDLEHNLVTIVITSISGDMLIKKERKIKPTKKDLKQKQVIK